MLNVASGEDYSSPDDEQPPVWEQPESSELGHPVVVLPRRQLLPHEEPLTNPWRNAKSLTQPRLSGPVLAEPAAPISPMRDRDLVVMLSWFESEDMAEVEKDVNYHLLLLFPEPYWEEDDWAFLYHYL
jgi:hypothetical protein